MYINFTVSEMNTFNFNQWHKICNKAVIKHKHKDITKLLNFEFHYQLVPTAFN